jgi:hypothetical protein
MNVEQLKAYLKHNQSDTEAFYALMDKLNSKPNQKIYSADEIEKLGELISSDDSRSVHKS